MILVDKEIWTGCTNKSVRVFDLKAQCIATMVEHSNDVKSVLLVNNQVWSGSMDETIVIFDKDTKQKINRITPKIGPIGCLQVYSQDNQKFICAGGHSRIIRYNASTLEVLDNIDIHKSIVRAMVLVGNELWTCALFDKVIGVIDLKTGKVLQLIEGNNSRIISLLAVEDNVWSCSWDSEIIVFDTKTHTILTRFSKCHTDAITDMNVIVKDRVKYVWSGSASQDGSICIFKTA